MAAGARSYAALFPDPSLLRRVGGALWGAVFPPRPAPPAPSEDARTHALRALRDYVAEIVFQVPEGKAGATAAYRVPKDRIFIEWPDDAATRQLMPSIEFLPGVAEHRFPGLTPTADESTIDVFGAGTVLVPQYEHVERIQIEVRAVHRSQRRLLLAALEQALQPSEDLGELRLLTEHYGQPVRFSSVERQNFDDEDSGRGRRRGTLTVEMGIDVCRLVRAVPIRSIAVPADVVTSDQPLPEIAQ